MHHETYPVDPMENKLMLDSNIKIIIKSNSKTGSYVYCFNSKFICI